MRAEKYFGRLATTMVIVAVAACAPVVRRNTSTAGGAGGDDPPGGATGGLTAGGGVTGSGGGTPSGGVGGSGSGGAGETGGAGGAGTSGGGTAGNGGVTAGGGAGGFAGTAAAGGGSGGGGQGGITSTVCGLGTSYAWSSTQALMNPVSDGSHSLEAIKAPTLVYYSGRYHVFATVLAKTTATPTLQHIQFADWSSAGSATADFLDNNSGLAGARSQPQVFYFNSKKTWYLVTQAPAPSYSTNNDLSLIAGWSKPVNFYGSTPSIVTQNAGSGGIGWTDFWIICDGSTCHMFFTNQKGYLFRAQTPVGSFPNGFGDPVVVMQSSYLVQGARIYKVSGGAGGYLMLVESTGASGSYIGAWSATALDGKWTALAETEANPFAGAGNLTFTGSKWTSDVGHGELVRSTYDETMTIDNCNMRYLYAGKDPYATAKAEPYPWKLGLLVRSR